jgi:hypothetical protein
MFTTFSTNFLSNAVLFFEERKKERKGKMEGE